MRYYIENVYQKHTHTFQLVTLYLTVGSPRFVRRLVYRSPAFYLSSAFRSRADRVLINISRWIDIEEESLN